MTNIEEEDFIEEEVLVFVDIEQTSIPESEIRDAKTLSISANEGRNCVLQINNRFFEGKFDYSIGTHVFFEKNEEATTDPLYSHCDIMYDFFAKTNKTLNMNRVLLKDVNSTDELKPTEEEKTDDLKITRTYYEALNMFLAPNRPAPRKINEEEEKILRDLLNTQNQEAMEQEDVGALTEAMQENSIEKGS